jgi:hypothetical protein
VVRACAAEMAAAKLAQQQRLERLLAREILSAIARRPFVETGERRVSAGPH